MTCIAVVLRSYIVEAVFTIVLSEHIILFTLILRTNLL